jgi:hypothetical protein
LKLSSKLVVFLSRHHESEKEAAEAGNKKKKLKSKQSLKNKKNKKKFNGSKLNFFSSKVLKYMTRSHQ